jgi:hypothetical protein
MTVSDLRDLVSYSSPINDLTATLYLELLTSQYQLAYLDTSFMIIMNSQGWQHLQKSFAQYRNRARSNTRPNIRGESAIIIPCFVDGCHWVSVVHREIHNQVIFLYADDLNNPSTETDIKRLLSHSTSNEFYPPSTIWITCTNYTYQPHSNECGPRALLAATIMALHPHPTHTILQPYTHPNLAQISRTWLACQLVSRQIDHNSLQPYLGHSTAEPRNNLRAPSTPYNLIPWDYQPSFKQNQSSPRSSLNPAARSFYPPTKKNQSAATSQSRPSFNSNTVQPVKEFNRPTQKKLQSGITYKPPARRTTVVLPGQGSITAFLCKKTTSQAPKTENFRTPSLVQ